MKSKILCLSLAICLLFTGCQCEHEWTEADCTNPKTCIKCGATEGESLGHDWTEATYKSPKKCQRCSITEGEPLVPSDEYLAISCAAYLLQTNENFSTVSTYLQAYKFSDAYEESCNATENLLEVVNICEIYPDFGSKIMPYKTSYVRDIINEYNTYFEDFLYYYEINDFTNANKKLSLMADAFPNIIEVYNKLIENCNNILN